MFTAFIIVKINKIWATNSEPDFPSDSVVCNAILASINLDLHI